MSSASDERDIQKSAATVLVDLALEQYSLHTTEAGETFVVPHAGASHLARRIRGGRLSMRADLARLYFKQTGKAAPQQALADAVLTIDGMAQQEDPEELHLRVAEADDCLWLDVGDTAGTLIKVTAAGWAIVHAAPVLFQRTALTMPMAMPRKGIKIDALWDVLNVAEADRALLIAVLAASFIPGMPHPIPAFSGEQGTGKSTAMRTLVSLIDPSAVPLRKPPRDAEGWVTAASGSWVCALDNISTIPDWFSDSLCRAVTGDGDVRRQLYSDGELAVFAFRRQVMLTSIDFAGMRGDLAERLVMVELHRIADHARRDERELNRTWERLRPQVFGALLDVLAGVWAVLPSVTLESKPRMADFARVLKAVDQVLGTDGYTRYTQQATTIAADTLASSPFIVLMIETIKSFTGSAAELLAEVTPGDPVWKVPRDWPRNARSVTSLLKRDAPALRKQGWTVDDLGASNHQKVTHWRISPPEVAGSGYPPPPHDPHTEPERGDRGDAGNDPGFPLVAECRVCGQALWSAQSVALGVCGKTDGEHEHARSVAA